MILLRRAARLVLAIGDERLTWETRIGLGLTLTVDSSRKTWPARHRVTDNCAQRHETHAKVASLTRRWHGESRRHCFFFVSPYRARCPIKADEGGAAAQNAPVRLRPASMANWGRSPDRYALSASAPGGGGCALHQPGGCRRRRRRTPRPARPTGPVTTPYKRARAAGPGTDLARETR